MVDAVNFKQLLVRVEALSQGDLAGVDGTRLCAYYATLEDLYTKYTQSSAHKRAKLRDYKRRMDNVRAAHATAVEHAQRAGPLLPESFASADATPTTTAAHSTTAESAEASERKPVPKKRRKTARGERNAQKRAEREERESEMASLATTLKHTATRLRDTLREDNAAVDKIAELVEANTEGTKTQRKKLEQNAPPWWRDLIKYAVTCVLALVVFFVANTFISHTTRKVPRFLLTTKTSSSNAQAFEQPHIVFVPQQEPAQMFAEQPLEVFEQQDESKEEKEEEQEEAVVVEQEQQEKPEQEEQEEHMNNE